MTKKGSFLIAFIFVGLLANSVLAQESIYKNLINRTVETIDGGDPFITLNEGSKKTFKIGEEAKDPLINAP